MQEDELRISSAEPKRLQSKDKSGCNVIVSAEPKRLRSKDKSGCNVIVSEEEIEKHLKRQLDESRENVKLCNVNKNKEPDESRENAKLCNVNKSWNKGEPSCRHVLNLQ
jgi:hypothetical protein